MILAVEVKLMILYTKIEQHDPAGIVLLNLSTQYHKFNLVDSKDRVVQS
jgi:hypothetical protein